MIIVLRKLKDLDEKWNQSNPVLIDHDSCCSRFVPIHSARQLVNEFKDCEMQFMIYALITLQPEKVRIIIGQVRTRQGREGRA
jgi:hypothetical protein